MPKRSDPETPPPRITDIELAKAVIAKDAVDCVVGKEDKPAAQPKQLVSCSGGAFWGKRGEAWPTAADGTPLIPWLQIVCTEMDRLYGAFHDRQVVCFYLREELDEPEVVSAPDGSDFVVLEYEPTDKLEPLARPKSLKGHPFHRVRWQRVADYPSTSRYYTLFDGEVYDTLAKTKNFPLANHSGIKIGGWPTPVQGEQQYPGAYDLQIDMTENFMFGDSGIGYLNRHGTGEWSVRFDCC